MTEALLWAAGLILLLGLDLAAFAARAAFNQTSHARLLSLRDEMEAQVNRTIPLLYVLPRLRLSLNLVLILARFGLASLFWVAGLWLRPNTLMLVLMVLAGSLVLFLLEFWVEQQVLSRPELLAMRLVNFSRAVMAVMALPLALPLAFAHQSQPSTELPATVTEDELKTLVDAGQEEGVLEEGERRMIHSIIDMGETLVREIMIPRIDMLALDVNTPFNEAVDVFLSSGHSRVPVYEETVDQTIGVLYAKDLLRLLREGSQVSSLRDLLRPAYFVPEAKTVDELLAEMQSQRIHIAMVVDEYGGIAGLVTLEDIVEEITGEIRDEYDVDEELPFQAMKNGEYLFQGRIGVDDVNELLGSRLPTEGAETLGGYIYSRLGRVPVVGDTVQAGSLLLTVEQVSGRRIRKVRVRPLLPEELKQEEESENAD